MFVLPSLQVYGQAEHIDKVNGQAILLINAENGQILYEKNKDQVEDVGSLSKMLLVYLVYQEIENGTIALNDTVPISNQAYELSQDYDISNVPLRQDYQYSVEELLNVVAVGNANGAAYALAEHVSSTAHASLEKMQDLLSEWGFDDAQLINVTGLPEDYDGSKSFDQYQGKTNQLSAHALATIAYRLVHDFPQYLQLTQQKSYTLKEKSDDPFTVQNQLELIEGAGQGLVGVQGLSMAYKPDFGYSQAIFAQRHPNQLISIVLGSNLDIEQMFFSSQEVIEYGFSAFETKTLLAKGSLTQEIPLIDVWGGKSLALETAYVDDLVMSVPVGENAPKIIYEHNLVDSLARDGDTLNAPIDALQVVGTVTATLEDQKLSFINQSSGPTVKIQANHQVDPIGTVGTVIQWLGQLIASLVEAVRKFFLNIFN